VVSTLYHQLLFVNEPFIKLSAEPSQRLSRSAVHAHGGGSSGGGSRRVQQQAARAATHNHITDITHGANTRECRGVRLRPRAAAKWLLETKGDLSCSTSYGKAVAAAAKVQAPTTNCVWLVLTATLQAAAAAAVSRQYRARTVPKPGTECNSLGTHSTSASCQKLVVTSH
jgi:hypothetical protein